MRCSSLVAETGNGDDCKFDGEVLNLPRLGAPVIPADGEPAPSLTHKSACSRPETRGVSAPHSGQERIPSTPEMPQLLQIIKAISLSLGQVFQDRSPGGICFPS